ncbi:hypothetical protein P3342_002173 [Pyrenophora teres f. teres]|nr:hypothetical protein P3342_002173 [Pyrenophora teres f. teres]
MLCRATSLVLPAIGLIDDLETDQRIASGARRRLKGLRLHVTRLGVFACVLLAVELFPSPALKPKPSLFGVIPAHRRLQARAQIPSAADLSPKPPAPTMLSLRFSLYHFTFNP